MYDAASFLYSLSVACVCEILKTTVITYSHKGSPIHWLIIKAEVNTFNRLIIHTNNGKNSLILLSLNGKTLI